MSLYSDRKAIRSLRSGVVPSSHVLRLSVGIDGVRPEIDAKMQSLKEAKPKPLVVLGEWGSGKSNLLCYLREYGLRNNIAVSYINLNGRETAINHPQRIYHKIISGLQVPRIHERGLIVFVELIQDPLIEAAIQRWAKLNYQKSELAKAFKNLYSQTEKALEIISGIDIAWKDYAYLKEKAIRRIKDLGSLFKSLGFSGIMLQVDELETIVQLWNITARQGAYKVLNVLSNLDNVWTIFAATEKLNHQFQLDLDSGKVNDFVAQFFIHSYSKFFIINPPTIDQQLGDKLLNRVTNLYRKVYDVPENLALSPVLEKWTKMTFGNPRKLIRQTIDFLDRHRSIPLFH